MTDSMHQPVIQQGIIRVRGSGATEEIDFLACEEPLEIRLLFGPAEDRREQNVSVTMRTPGQDFDLAIGFLFTEGIICSATEITDIKHCGGIDANVVRITLRADVTVNISKLERNFYTTSSCGVCGKASIDAVRTVSRLGKSLSALRFASVLLPGLPDRLRAAQSIFNNTGGLHACAFFDNAGSLVMCREDVGRHNAVDKLIGAALQTELFPLDEYLLLLSGRASFELIQKAAMAGIQIVAAVGAPSSLAVQMAEESGITLIGFLRERGFNIYSHHERILMSAHENSH